MLKIAIIAAFVYFAEKFLEITVNLKNRGGISKIPGKSEKLLATTEILRESDKILNSRKFWEILEAVSNPWDLREIQENLRKSWSIPGILRNRGEFRVWRTYSAPPCWFIKLYKLQKKNFRICPIAWSSYDILSEDI